MGQRPPTHHLPDSTLAFRRDPYRFVSRTCEAMGTEAFQARILFRPTIMVTGVEAARLFYDPGRFVRHGAVPARIRRVLFGKGGVQGLDGAAHVHRKALLMSLMRADSLDALDRHVRSRLHEAVADWQKARRVVLYDALYDVVGRAVAGWAGVPSEPQELTRRARQMTDLFEHCGSVGPPYWRAVLNRHRVDAWCSSLVRRTREGEIDPPEGSALRTISDWRDLEDRPLDLHTAGVELLNVLRPTVAVAVWMTFVAHALHVHRARPSGEAEVRRFVQEVRRTYPFFPAVMARVRDGFEWHGWHFPQGRGVILDLWGTNRDARVWEDRHTFLPERFAGREPGAFDLVPQGGGSHDVNHRCAGEWITIRLMQIATVFLTEEIAYDVPEQNLGLNWRNLPGLPHDRMVVENVRASA